MAATKMMALEKWFKDNGGYLHPSVHISYDEQLGAHFRTLSEVPAGERILTVPHHLAISNLNAQVDDAFPVFRTHAKSFTVEALTFFYLVAQWINRGTSFWGPYLETLPAPEKGYETPLWFDDDDRKWLEGTDLQPTSLAREAAWRKYWQDGIEVMKSANVDVAPYTWELFKWAATVYTSRSFNPQTVRPEDGSKWTAYKHTADGPQAVLLDLNNYPDDWQTFSVLFPVMDAGNHNPNAKVDWAYDPGKFSLSIREGVSKGDEIFNNYGPKGNDELLMGYGFCAEDNPHDGILLSMKPPPQPLQSMLQMIHPHYFRPTGEWNSDAATFRLLRWQLHDTEDTSEFGAFTRAWAPIPEPLLELFCYIVQFERGVPVSPIDNPEDYLKRGYGQRYLPRIALYILMSMLPKIHKLEHSDAELPEEPQNSRQANAKIYRDCQMEVLDAVQERMAAYLKSLILEPSTDPIRRSATWTLEGALEVIQREAPDAHKAFMSGVKYCTGTTKLRKLRGTEQEEFMWTILLCFAYLHSQKTKAAADANKNGILSNWMRSLEAEYGSPLPEEGAEVEVDEVADEDAEEYLGRVKKAAMFLPGSIWTSPAWTGDFVLDWGVRLVKSQGTYMEVDEGDMRYVVYLHIGA